MRVVLYNLQYGGGSASAVSYIMPTTRKQRLRNLESIIEALRPLRPDVLGMNNLDLHHSKRYADFRTQAIAALRDYARDVASGAFPAEENARHMAEAERASFEKRCAGL